MSDPLDKDLAVRQGRTIVPFSRGILARSLLRIGLEATRAYDIARRIDEELHREGLSELTASHLARLLSDRITRHAGPEFGERYEKLRLFKRSTRPLVVLLGGSTGSGKSTVATEIAHRLDITRIQSTDSIRHVMRSMISEKLLPSIHRSSFEERRRSALPSDPALDPHVAALLEQVQYVAVAVEAVLERAAQENLSTILEGVHLVPGIFQRFAAESRLHFVHLVVTIDSEDEHRQRFLSRGRAAAGRPGERYLKNFTAIRAIQQYLVERAQATQVPVIVNRDLDLTVQDVLGRVLDGYGEATPIVPRPRP